MASKFSELRAKMTPEARAESAKIAAALRAEAPLHQRRQALQVSQISGYGGQRYENAFQAGSNSDTCTAVENVATYLQLDMDAPMTITTISSREFNRTRAVRKKRPRTVRYSSPTVAVLRMF